MSSRRERKLVTVVFVDLVGFTARAEELDPEDVEAILRPYHERLRSELERHGGTVEKFIGDAVMAVFGAPVAHEDDAERAARAALAIRDWAAEEGELEVRIAVNTGEALVSLDARPEAGEAMVAGDVVNTAARLQTAAAVNGILVGEQTHRATSHVIDYREAEPVEAKGKAAPVPTWEALQARARFGVDVRQLARSNLVGREKEIRAIRELFERVSEERQPRAITLVGAPGIGKSRLVYELFQIADQYPEILYWRQGRCLPYGDGVSFWAFAEVVKAQTGILETDSSEEAEGKLRRAVLEAVGEGGDAEWVLTHLRPLVGLAGEAGAGESRQAESFFAWRRFLEAVASERPLVLVFEDLHWADERFLDFVEHLREWVVDVPLFLLGTSRPELLTRRPGWPDVLRLSPLSDDDTAALVHALLARTVLPAEMQTTLLERAGGNPLYAEEFARMAGERGFDGELPLPQTVQGVIAARIDGLAPEDKELLGDGAVVGKVFWAGAVAAIAGDDRWTLEERLQGLARRDFLRRERRSSVEGESEYAFLHVLVRDVAYGSIPRAGRAEKHRLAAEWLETLSDDRTEDRAELLAHHYGQALELARASGRAEDAERLEEPARRYLILAGDRAFQLDVLKAASYYERALAALAPDDPERARMRARLADTAQEDGRLHEAVAGYAEAIPILRGQNDVQGTGEAMVRLALALWRIGETARSSGILEEAIELLEREPLGPTLVRAYTRTAVNHVLAGRRSEGLEWTGRALPLAEKLGLHGEVARLLQMRGIAKAQSASELHGVEDLRQALAIALEHGLGFEAATSYSNLGETIEPLEGPGKALELLEAGVELAEGRGLTHHAWWTRAAITVTYFDLGRWDDALELADEVIAWDRDHGRSQMEVQAAQATTLIHILRGNLAEAERFLEYELPRSRDIGDVQTHGPALIIAAMIEQERGRPNEARRFLEELDELTRDTPQWRILLLTATAQIGAAVGATELAARHLDEARAQAGRASPYAAAAIATAQAVLAEARTELEPAVDFYRHAVEGWRRLGIVHELAGALGGLGRSLVGLGRYDEAAAPLAEARELFVGLGARPFITETDELLERVTAAAS
jgi:class 3 adenylate cyclase/tetratricopeptide (TPR) repeat protein